MRELRCHYGRQHYRVLYRRSDRLFVLLHIFSKGTAKIPAAETNLAQQRWQDFTARMDAQTRRPPRAAGHDAP
ncbi:MAG: type II toxin-antitoxin system RelE/ParE family toxin [Acidimicrobiales bacterium]